MCFAPETGRGKTPRFGSDLFPPGKNPAMAAAETNRADDAQTTTPPPIRVPAAAAPVRAPTCPLFPSARKVRFGKRGQRSAYAAPASSHTPRRTSGCLRVLRCLPSVCGQLPRRRRGLPDLPGILLLSVRPSCSGEVRRRPLLCRSSRWARGWAARLVAEAPCASVLRLLLLSGRRPRGAMRRMSAMSVLRLPIAPLSPRPGGDAEAHRFRLIKQENNGKIRSKQPEYMKGCVENA